MSLQEHEICLKSISFALYVKNNNILSHKNVDLSSFVFKKIIPDAIIPTFQDSAPHMLLKHKIFLWVHINYHNID